MPVSTWLPYRTLHFVKKVTFILPVVACGYIVKTVSDMKHSKKKSVANIETVTFLISATILKRCSICTLKAYKINRYPFYIFFLSPVHMRTICNIATLTLVLTNKRNKLFREFKLNLCISIYSHERHKDLIFIWKAVNLQGNWKSGRKAIKQTRLKKSICYLSS